MKALYTAVFVFFALVKAFPQYLLCNEIPLQYLSDSITFGKSDDLSEGDSMLIVPIVNLSDTIYYEVEAKLVVATPLPGGVSQVGNQNWEPFAAMLQPGQIAIAKFYFKVDSLIPPEFKTSFRLWVTDPVKSVFDSCVFADFVTVNLNAQIVPQVLNESGSSNLHIFPVPATDLLHIVFDGAENAEVVGMITDASGKSIIEQKRCSTNWDMDISSLQPGTYFFKIRQNRQQSVIPFDIAR
jgi:Secretion system C-terminal sorting domain